MQNSLTSGSVLKSILRFSLPYLLSYFLQTLYGMADLFLIGRYGGVDGTTAVSIGSQVMHMLTVMIVGLAMGATVMIGQAVGAQNRARANRYIGNAVTLFAGTAAVLTLTMLSLSGAVVRLMSTPAAAQAGTEAYLRICFAGLPFIIAYNVISAIFRGMGDSKSPMYFIAAACVANIGLDILFMGPLALGPAGAALGTTLSQAFSVVLSLIVVVRRRMLPDLSAAHLRPQREILGDMVKIGVPVALQDGFIQVSFLAITVFANLRGLNDAAAVGIVEKIIGILFLVPSTMLSTVSALAARTSVQASLSAPGRSCGTPSSLRPGWGWCWPGPPSSAPLGWWGCSPSPTRWPSWAASTCAAMCGTACWRASTSASAATFAPAVCPAIPSPTTSFPFCAPGCLWPGWPAGTSRAPCFPWAVPRRPVRWCRWWSARCCCAALPKSRPRRNPRPPERPRPIYSA